MRTKTTFSREERVFLQQDDKISTDGFEVEKRLEKTDTTRYVCVREGEGESRDLPKKSYQKKDFFEMGDDWKSFNGSGEEKLTDLDDHVKKGIGYVKKAIKYAEKAEKEAEDGNVRFARTDVSFFV